MLYVYNFYFAFKTFEEIGSRWHTIRSMIYYAFYSCLDYGLWATETRRERHIYGAAISFRTTCFDYCIFFSMDAETFFKALSWDCHHVTSWTASFIAVFASEGCSIIPSGYDTIVVYYHCTYWSFHAVRSGWYNFSKSQEVGIPLRSYQLWIWNLKF